MYRFFRNTHLLLGITAFLFVLMYGLSAVQMAHQSWFSMKPTVTETRVAIPAGVADDPRAIAQELAHQSMRDRKSTRLNSSHSQISYAVFCLKKKKKTKTNNH